MTAACRPHREPVHSGIICDIRDICGEHSLRGRVQRGGRIVLPARGAGERTVPPGLQRTHIVALADLDAVVACDVVGGGAVEEEVRQAEMQQIGLPLE